MNRVLAAVLLSLVAGLSSATPVAVLYKRESSASLPRTDSTSQAALQSFEEKLIEAGQEVIQASPTVHDALDRAAGVVVTFAPDAGHSVLVDIVKATRPNPGTLLQWADVRMRVRAYSGRRVLASLAATGQMAFREGAEDKAFEAAARRAVAQIIPGLIDKLQNAPPPVADLFSPKIDAVGEQPVVPDMPPVDSPPGAGQRHALLLGVSDFSGVRALAPGVSVKDLPAVVRDLAIIKRTLIDLGVPAPQIRELLNRQATAAALRQALAELARATRPEDVVFVYMSSHGMPKDGGYSGYGYPVVYDTGLLNRAGIVDFEEIQTALRQLPARRVVWVADTCHSGGALAGMATVEISSKSIVLKSDRGFDADLVARAAGKDMVILTSSRAEQESWAKNEGGSFFTEILARGMSETRGRATVYQVYKDYLEQGVPQAVRAYCANPKTGCGRVPDQQPGFAGSGNGRAITF